MKAMEKKGHLVDVAEPGFRKLLLIITFQLVPEVLHMGVKASFKCQHRN